MISVESMFNYKSKSFNEEFNILSTLFNKQNASDFLNTILSPIYLPGKHKEDPKVFVFLTKL